jgi:hypothetical protein
MGKQSTTDTGHLETAVHRRMATTRRNARGATALAP